MSDLASFDTEPVIADDLSSAIRQCLPPRFEAEVVRSLAHAREGWVRIPLVDILQPPRRRFFDRSSTVVLPREQLDRLKQIDVYRIGTQPLIQDACIVMARCDLKGMIGIGRSGARLFFGEDVSANVDIRAWRNSKLFVGAGTTINKARLVLDDVGVGIGDDAMLSDEILIQGGDQHSIWSLETMSVINQKQKPVLIGEHAWIGRRATIMAGAEVGCGAIIGAGSIVTGAVEPFSLAVGSPAKTAKRGVTWSRNIDVMTPVEQAFVSRRSGANLAKGEHKRD